MEMPESQGIDRRPDAKADLTGHGATGTGQAQNPRQIR